MHGQLYVLYVPFVVQKFLPLQLPGKDIELFSRTAAAFPILGQVIVVR